MTKEGWHDRLRYATPEEQEVMAEYLAQIDQARQILRDKGYGVVGTPIVDQVNEVLAKDFSEMMAREVFGEKCDA